MQIHHSHDSDHSALMKYARKLIEYSKGLLEQSSSSTFLGAKRYDPVPLAPRFHKRPLLRIIDGDRSRTETAPHSRMEWQAIRTAPFCRDLQLAVINAGGVHAVVFPCRRVLRGWVKTVDNEQVYVRPTHWREWRDGNSALFSLVSSLEQGR